MKKLILLITVSVALVSCKTKKYFECDAYKTHYTKIKADKHKHALCDAYN